jgi:5-methylthioadenosine/S-adenosylhomocysteine deaminase
VSEPARPETLVLAGCDALVQPGTEIARDVEIVIRDRRIAALDRTGTRQAEAGERVIDARGLLAIPGLVNAHTHSGENPLRGLGEGLAMEPWLALMLGTAGKYSPEDHYACALAGAVEMLHNGTTAVLDHLWMTPPSVEAVDAAMRAYRDVGIRAAVAPLVDDTDFTEQLAEANGLELVGSLLPQRKRGKPAELAAHLDAVMTAWHGAEGGRLRVLAGPCGVQWCSDELLLALADVAERHQSAIHIHLLETKLEDLSCRQRFGYSAVRGLEALGILRRCSLPHSVWIDDEDVELIAEHRAIVVHNPAANLRLCSGLAPVRALLDAGATVALGTDGAAASDNQVLWDALKLVALIHNYPGERWISTREALTMATRGGAAVFGLEGELGALAPGMLADITLVDRTGDGLAGAHDVEASLVLSETGRGVRHVIVAGELVVIDGRCTRVDEDAAHAALAELARRRAGVKPTAETLDAIRQVQELRRALQVVTTA